MLDYISLLRSTLSPAIMYLCQIAFFLIGHQILMMISRPPKICRLLTSMEHHSVILGILRSRRSSRRLSHHLLLLTWIISWPDCDSCKFRRICRIHHLSTFSQHHHGSLLLHLMVSFARNIDSIGPSVLFRIFCTLSPLGELSSPCRRLGLPWAQYFRPWDDLRLLHLLLRSLSLIHEFLVTFSRATTNLILVEWLLNIDIRGWDTSVLTRQEVGIVVTVLLFIGDKLPVM